MISSGVVIGFLERPQRVAVFCGALLVFTLLSDGSLWRLYTILQNQKMLTLRIQEEKASILRLKQQLGQLKNPAYIEKQARERLEFLEKGDLLFVFSEE